MISQYKTNSLQLASYLSCCPNIKFIGVDKENLHPLKVSFIFEPPEEVQKNADEYFSGRANCNPLKLYEKYRTLKDLVFEVKRSEEENPRS